MLETVANGREVLGERFMISNNCGLLEEEVRRVVKEIVAGQIGDEEGAVKVAEVLSRLNRVGAISEESKQALAELKSGKKDFADVDKFADYDLEACFDRAPAVAEKIKKNASAMDELDRIICMKLKQRLDAIRVDSGCLNEVQLIADGVNTLPDALKLKSERLVQACRKRLLQDLEVKFTEAENLVVAFLKHPNYSRFDLKACLESMRSVVAVEPSRFEERLASVEAKMAGLVAEMKEGFEKSLDGMDVAGLKRQLEFVEFVGGDYEGMEREVVARVDLWVEGVVGAELLDGLSGRSMAAFEKLFEALSAKLQAVCAVERLLKERLERVRDVGVAAEECVRSLGRQAEKQYREGCERLRLVIDGEEEVEVVKEFIANYYNLVLFERKMPQLEEGRMGCGDRVFRTKEQCWF